MRKNALYSVLMLSILVLGMTACGDGEERLESSSTDTQEVIVELVPEQLPKPELSENEKAILDYELRYSKGEFVLEDYQALAGLYQEQGLIRKQRDMLEQCYRLYDNQQAFEMLQTISVNLDEEDAGVQEQARLMLQNLELEEYLSESINLISSDVWFDTMMPKLYEGSRTYFLQRNGETALFVQVGYDEYGTAYSDVWFMGEQVKVLRHSGDAVQLLITGMEDGQYQGTFESWLCDGRTGDIYHETGTFANGVLTGDYTAAIHSGTEGSDAYSLWCNREGMEYTTYTGNFDEQGMTTLEQPASNKIKSLIKNTDFSTCKVYAYDEDNARNCLFEGLTENVDAETFTFGIEAMGWKTLPAFTTYEVVEDEVASATDGEGAKDSSVTVNLEDIKVRVFDGELQVYLNDAWVSMGVAEQFIKEDPFQAYEDNKVNAGEPDVDSQTGGSLVRPGGNRVRGEIPKDVVKPATKPAAPTPAPEPTPAPTPAPTPSPSPQAPVTPPSDSGSSSGSNSGGNSNNNSGGGNDVDIEYGEWGDDIL